MYNIDKIYWLIEDCKRFGTLPFAGIARCAFISRDILNSFVQTKILTEKELEVFLKSIKTISSEINTNLYKLSSKKFKDKYGHIRPNTYDIESKNYFDNYKITSICQKFQKKSCEKFTFSKFQRKINEFIKDLKLNLNFKELINFIIFSINKESIQNLFYKKY